MARRSKGNYKAYVNNIIRPPQLQFFKDNTKIMATDTKYY